MTDERSLAEASPEADEKSLADLSVDVTPDLDPDDFDFEAFLDGVRPARRAVKVYARADLLADLDELEDEITRATKSQDRNRLVKRFDQVRDEFYASGRYFVVEARSGEWIEEFQKQAEKRLGVDAGLDVATAEDLTPEQVKARQDIGMLLLAQQIVVPSNVTVEGLQRLAERVPGEVSKLIVAQTMVNRQVAETAKVLTRDFSPAPSGQTKAPGSTKR